MLLTVLIERISTFLIKKLGRKNEWDDEIINGIAFFGRLIIIIIGVGVVTSIGGLPSELGITITAIVGAAIGLASTKTIGNIMAGFSVLLSRSFSIGDYIKIGESEGLVCEMTINYTKILTKKDRTILIPNTEVASSQITRFCTNDVAKTYTLYPTFDYALPTTELLKIFEKVINKYVPERIIEIRYELTEVNYLYTMYEFSFIFDFVDDYFTLPSEFLKDLMIEYDSAKRKKMSK